MSLCFLCLFVASSGNISQQFCDKIRIDVLQAGTEPAEQAAAYSLGRKPQDRQAKKIRACEAGDSAVARFTGSISFFVF